MKLFERPSKSIKTLYFSITYFTKKTIQVMNKNRFSLNCRPMIPLVKSSNFVHFGPQIPEQDRENEVTPPSGLKYCT